MICSVPRLQAPINLKKRVQTAGEESGWQGKMAGRGRKAKKKKKEKGGGSVFFFFFFFGFLVWGGVGRRIFWVGVFFFFFLFY